LKRPGVSILSHTACLPFQARMLQTAYQAAKAQFTSGQTSYSPYFDVYTYMTPFYREYRRNWLVRRAVNTLAFWTTKEGFDTELELVKPPPNIDDTQEEKLLESYQPAKDYIDDINKTVGADDAWRTAQVKRSIHGHSAFEIVGTISNPERLLPLDSTQIEPLINNDWILKGYSYEGKGSLTQPFYQPEEVLYFTLNDFEGDMKGLSDIEPIVADCDLYDKIVREDLTEALTVLWAGIVLYLLDRSKLGNTTDATVQSIIDDFVAQIKPGKSLATENVWSAQVVDVHPDLTQILGVVDNIERSIVGALGVPRYMLNLKVEGWSRANAYAELEAFVDSAVTDSQRTLRRQIEAQWYLPMLQSQLGKKQAMAAFLKLLRRGQKVQLPVKLNHVWRETRTADWLELFRSVTQAYNGGMGWISTEKAYEIMTKGKSADFSQDAYDKAQKLSMMDQPVPLAQDQTPTVTSKPYDTKEEAVSAVQSFKDLVANARIVDLTGEPPYIASGEAQGGPSVFIGKYQGKYYIWKEEAAECRSPTTSA